MRGGSQVWKKILHARDLIEHQILWSVKKGKVFFWHDNWIRMSDFYIIIGENVEWDHFYETIKKVKLGDKWNTEILGQILLMELTDYIIHHIKPPRADRIRDRPYWMLNNKGSFTVKTAWQYIRHKEEPNKI